MAEHDKENVLGVVMEFKENLINYMGDIVEQMDQYAN
jgi:hypothetical protein